MKKLLRLGFSIGLGALCIGILTLVASLLSWIKLVDVYTVVSSSVIAGVYIGVGVLGMLLGFIFYPKMMRGIAGGMKRIEAKADTGAHAGCSLRYTGADRRADTSTITFYSY